MKQYFTTPQSIQGQLLVFFEQTDQLNSANNYILSLRTVPVDTLSTMSEYYTFVRMAGDYPVFTKRVYPV